MMRWVSQQQLQYSTGGRSQQTILVLGDMTQKKLLDELHIHTELLTNSWQALYYVD